MAQVQTSTERKLQVKEVGPCKFEVQVEVPAADVKGRLEERYQELNETVQLPGFRRGHAPRRVLEKRFGEEVASEIKVALIGDALREIREKNDLTPLDDPEVDLAKIALSEGAACTFSFNVEVKPKITFDGYKGIPAAKPAAVVADADVEEALTRLREAKAELVPASDGRVAENDQVVADLDVTLDGASLQKNADAAFFVHGAMAVFGQPAPDLARALIGRKSGDDVSVPIALPAEHADAKLAGKTVQVAVKVKEIKRRQLPEATEAWAKEMGFDDLAALRARVRERLQQEKEHEATHRTQEEILAEIRKRAAITLPAGVVEKESIRILRRWAMDLYLQGVPEEEIEKRVAEQQGASKDAIALAMQNQFLIEHIAGREKIFVTEAEVEDHIAQIASRAGRWPQEVKKHLEKHDQLPDLRRKLREEKVMAFLLQHASLV
jgi:trigger factor